MRAVLALALAVLLAGVLPASAETVVVEIIDRNGDPVADVTVMLCNATKCPWTNTTDPNGIAVLEAPNGTYLLVAFKKGFGVLDIVTVSGDTRILLDLRNTPRARVDSKPISVAFEVTPTAFNRTVEFSTPTDLYAKMVLDISFPGEVEKFPFTYKLEKIEYNGNTVENKTSITLAMDRDYNVTAHYSQQFATALSTPVLLALAVFVAVGVIIAWKVATRTAGETIAEYKRYRKFVEKRRE